VKHLSKQCASRNALLLESCTRRHRNKSLQIQTQELATAVVQTVLNDPEVLAKAASFLKDASQTPETQAALLQLTMHVLRHPDTLEQLVNVTRELSWVLSRDRETISQVSVLTLTKRAHVVQLAV
jgi:hypothetical protein